jgi:hypothetical protein
MYTTRRTFKRFANLQIKRVIPVACSLTCSLVFQIRNQPYQHKAIVGRGEEDGYAMCLRAKNDIKNKLISVKN